MVNLVSRFFNLMTDTQHSSQRDSQTLIRRVTLILFGLVLFLYLIDFAWYQLRVVSPHLGVANGTVHRTRVLAIAEKNNKVEYEIDSNRPEEDVPCAHSLFPHAGNHPCWYVTRHANDPIPM